jgi:hypothetical protein
LSRRALREESRAQHGPIEIDRGTRKTGLPGGVVRDLAKQPAELVTDHSGRLLQRIGDRAVCGELLQTGEAEEQRVPLQDPQVTQSRPAEQQHTHQGQRDAKRSIVAIELPDREDLLEPLRKARTIDETPEQLDPPVRAELLVAEDDRKIALDTASNRVFPYSHECGPLGGGRLVALSSIPPTGPLSIWAFHHASLLRIRVSGQTLLRHEVV